jgi:hypothetical protein
MNLGLLVEIQLLSSLISAPYLDEWLLSNCGPFTLEEVGPGDH